MNAITIAWGLFAFGAIVMIVSGIVMSFVTVITLPLAFYSIGVAITLFGASQVASQKMSSNLNARLDTIETMIKNSKYHSHARLVKLNKKCPRR